ncbi:hypothetical protein QFC21_007280 [Naganishia friedmannii]|uniref:Uncharacterized protein n=1 Tax=Naganishia friedmannii TaxID=89922 RepID=A0ACC2UWZ1_9TREE|nr:hypothetical protein QFC21_007280 [Naganishia friedmannii]
MGEEKRLKSLQCALKAEGPSYGSSASQFLAGVNQRIGSFVARNEITASLSITAYGADPGTTRSVIMTDLMKEGEFARLPPEWNLDSVPAVGVPIEAHLSHYFQLNPQLESLIQVASDVYTAARQLDNRLCELKMDIQTFPSPFARKYLLKQVDEVKRNYEMLQTGILSNTQVQFARESLARLHEDAKKIENLNEVYKERYGYIERLLDTPELDSRPHQIWKDWIHCDNAEELLIGIVPSQRLKEGIPVFPSMTDSKRKQEDGSYFGRRKVRMLLDMPPGCILLAYKVSYLKRGNNGFWRPLKRNLLRRNNCEILIESGLSSVRIPGIDYDLDYWYGKEEDYNFPDLLAARTH